MTRTDIRIRTQHAQDHILYCVVTQLTDIYNDWDLALAEHDARSILDELAAQQQAATPLTEPWWARFIPLAGVVGLVVTFAPLAALAAIG